jgi:hypothetical protein
MLDFPSFLSRSAKHACMALSVSLAAICLALVCASSAVAALEVEDFSAVVADSNGIRATQAGGHPDFSTRIALQRGVDGEGHVVVEESAKDIDVALPAGVVGDPTGPKCTLSGMRIGELAAFAPDCPPEAQVGIAYASLALGLSSTFDSSFPIFNIEPPAGVPARLAFNALGVVVIIDASVRAGGDYGITAKIKDLTQTIPLVSSTVKLWGVPADPANDDERFAEHSYTPGGTPSKAPLRPFMTAPTRCSGDFSTKLRARSWLDPETWVLLNLDKDVNGEPFEGLGCENLDFKPKIDVAVGQTAADSPAGFDLNLSLPQNDDPDGLATAHLKKAVVKLPEGMAINPASADGLASCSSAQIALSSEASPTCPDASKIGTVTVDTPVLDEDLTGNVFLAKQADNPFNSTLAMYLVAEGSGVVIKLPGRIAADPVSGQVTATFDNNPQLPFNDLSVHLNSGYRAPLLTPPTCGSKQVTASFSSWAMPDETVTSSDSFAVTSGPNGGPCPNGAFNPTMKAGTTSPIAGTYSPFVMSLRRDDGTQRLQSLGVTFPEGLLGKLAGIPYCPDATLAGISGTEGTGAAQIASPSCPAVSQVGTVSVGAGAGATPFYANTGKAYLAGPYKGAPLSLAIVTPAVAGPFDLGSVVVRNALNVDPVSAKLTAVSDPLPTILHGIPLDIRDIRISIDRSGFTLNPTSCAPMRFSGSATGTSGAIAPLGSRFQVTNCAALGFGPKLALRLSGPTHRSAHPKLRAVLTARKGDANIGRAQVTLPKTEFLENAHIKTICTRVQYAAKACPAKSIYGYAKAWSPLLDQPLEGPVYLRSSSHELPDLVASLDGQIHVDLAGRIDSVNARIRNTFEAVPDAPVSKFVLTMQGGKKGLLVNNTELCKTTPRAEAVFEGQNGKASIATPIVKADCGKKK